MKKPIIGLALVVLVLAAVGFPGCTGGMGQAPPAAPAETTPPRGPRIFIETDANMDKDAYLPGDDVIIELSFKNVTQEPFQLQPFPPLIQIMRPSPYDEPVRSFLAGEAIKTLEPDEVVTYILTWDQRGDQGQQVAYGRYYLKLGKIKFEDYTMSLSFGRYVSLLILPTEGVIEKTIEMNESRTVDGITVTLNRVELTATGMEVYAFNVPPDYNLPQGPNLPPPPLMELSAEAEYSLDGGPVTETEPSAIGFLEDGMRHSWKHLNPVPKGTREITFVITKLGDWEGPWKFRVPLD